MRSLHGSRKQGCDMYHPRNSHVTLSGVRGGHRASLRRNSTRAEIHYWAEILGGDSGTIRALAVRFTNCTTSISNW